MFLYAAFSHNKWRMHDLLFLNYVETVAHCSRCVHMFATGDGLLRQTDETTDDDLKQIFATNLFGHFILVSLYALRIC